MKDGTVMTFDDCCPCCNNKNPREHIPSGASPIVTVEPSGTLDPITNIFVVRRNSMPTEISVQSGVNLRSNYNKIL